ncbi:MAG: hypothetical protein ABSA84_03850, partial [Gammaproteobacteria bacterium]
MSGKDKTNKNLQINDAGKVDNSNNADNSAANIGISVKDLLSGSVPVYRDGKNLVIVENHQKLTINGFFDGNHSLSMHFSDGVYNSSEILQQLNDSSVIVGNFHDLDNVLSNALSTHHAQQEDLSIHKKHSTDQFHQQVESNQISPQLLQHVGQEVELQSGMVTDKQQDLNASTVITHTLSEQPSNIEIVSGAVAASPTAIVVPKIVESVPTPPSAALTNDATITGDGSPTGGFAAGSFFVAVPIQVQEPDNIGDVKIQLVGNISGGAQNNIYIYQNLGSYFPINASQLAPYLHSVVSFEQPASVITSDFLNQNIMFVVNPPGYSATGNNTYDYVVKITTNSLPNVPLENVSTDATSNVEYILLPVVVNSTGASVESANLYPTMAALEAAVTNPDPNLSVASVHGNVSFIVNDPSATSTTSSSNSIKPIGSGTITGPGNNITLIGGTATEVATDDSTIVFTPTAGYVGLGGYSYTVVTPAGPGNPTSTSSTNYVIYNVVSAPNQLVNSLGAQIVFSNANGNAITIADTAGASASDLSKTIEVQLSAVNGTVSLGTNITGSNIVTNSSSNVITITDNVANINNYLNGLIFTSNGQSGAQINVVVDNLRNTSINPGSGLSYEQTINIATNNTTITIPQTAVNVDSVSSLVNLPGGNDLKIGDLVGGSNATITVRLSAANGTIGFSGSVSNATITSGHNNTITITDTVSNINADLNQLTFTPVAGVNNGSITVLANDISGVAITDPSSNSQTLNIVVNDAVVAVPTQTINTDMSLVLSTTNGNAITISDAANASNIAVQLNSNNGIIGSNNPLTGVTVTGNNSGSMTITGSVANVNNYLNGLMFTPNSNFSGATSISVLVNDISGMTGTTIGAASSASYSKILNIDVNDAKSTIVSQTVNLDNTDVSTALAIPINAITISDASSAANNVIVQLSVANNGGTLASTGSTSNLTITGGGTGVMTITGSVTNINHYLQGLTFTPTVGFSGQANITVLTNDLSGVTGATIGSASNASYSQILNVEVNDARSTVVSQTINLDNTDTSTALLIPITNAITIIDASGAAGNIMVQLNVANNGGTLSSIGSISNLNITGSGTGVLTITGSVANINTYLNGLTFTPTVGFSGAANITVLTNDISGVTSATIGSVSNASYSQMLNIEVNDARSTVVSQTINLDNTDASAALSLPIPNAITIIDTSSAANNVMVQLSVANNGGTLASTGSAANLTITGSGTGIMSITGGITNINNYLQHLTFTPTSGFSGATSITVLTNDLSGITNATIGVASNASYSQILNLEVNDARATVVSQTINLDNTDSSTALSIPVTNAITIIDASSAASNVMVQLSVANNGGTLASTGSAANLTVTGSGTGVVTITGNVANINTYLNSLTFTPTVGFSGQANITVLTNDLSGITGATIGSVSNASYSQTLNIEVNDARSTVVSQTINLDNTDTSTALSIPITNAITIVDVSSAANNVMVQLSVANNGGTLASTGSAANLTITGGGTGVLTITGSIANINNYLNNLTFTPTNGFSGQANITVLTNDLSGVTSATVGTPSSASYSQTLNIDVNDARTTVVSQTINLDNTNNSMALSMPINNAITIVDASSAASNVMVQLSVANNGGTLASTVSVSNLTVTGSGTSVLTITGNVANINSYLNSLTFTPTVGFSGAANITVLTNDLAGITSSIIGVSSNASYSQTLNVEVNDATTKIPIQTIDINTPLILSTANGNAITVSDTSNSNIMVQLNVANNAGSISSSNSVTALTSVNVNASGTTMTLVGAAANINAYLNGLTFTPSSTFSGATNITVLVNDIAGTTGATISTSTSASYSQSLNIFVNDATTTIPVQTVNIDTPLVLSVANGNAITVSDASNANIMVQLNVANNSGIISSNNSSTPLVSVSGNSSGSMTLVGSAVNINAYLNGLTFTPNSNFSGPTNITVIVNDIAGITGSSISSSGSASYSQTLNVFVNDAIVTEQVTNVNMNTGLVLSSANNNVIQIVDNALATTTNPIVVQLTSANGTLNLSNSFINSHVIIAGANNSASITIQDTLSNINAYLNGLTFTPNANYSGAANITVLANDLPGVSITDPSGATYSKTLNISINDASVVESLASINMNTSVVLSSVNGNVIQIVDGAMAATINPITVQLTATHGTMSLSSSFTNNAVIVGGANNSNYMVITDTLSNINAYLNGLTYTPATNYSGAANITVLANDLPGVLINDSSSYSQVLNIEVNDARILLSSPNVSVDSNAAFFSLAGQNSIQLADSYNPSVVTVQLTATNGTIGLGNLSNSAIQVTHGVNNTITIVDSVSHINAYLGWLTFTPAAGFSGVATITTIVNDIVGVPVTDPSSYSKILNIDVVQVNDATAVLPANTNTYANTDLVLSGVDAIQISDTGPAANSSTINTVQLTATNGILSLGSNFTDSSAIIAGANHSNTITITGTLSNINSYLNGLTFTPTTGFNGVANIKILSSDSPTGLSDPYTNLENVTVNVLKYTPSISDFNPTPATFTAGANPVVIAGSVTISDPNELDSFNGGIGNYSGSTLTIARFGGSNTDDVFSFASVPGVTVNTITGTNNGTLVYNNNVIANFTNGNGQLQIDFVTHNGVVPTTNLANAIVESVQYSNSNQLPPQSVTLAYTFNDGIVHTNVMATTAVNISNYPPAINDLSTVSPNVYSSDTYTSVGSPIIISPTVTIASLHKLDSFNGGLGDYNGASLTITRSSGANLQDVFSFGNIQGNVTVNYDIGAISTGGHTIATFTVGAGQLQINFVSSISATATTALVNNIIDSIQYSNSSLDAPASVNLTYLFNAGVNGNNLFVTATTTVDILQTANPPINAVPVSQSLTENANLVFSTANNNQISVSDVNANGGAETVTLTVTNGVLALSTTNGLTVGGNNTGTVVLTGTLTNLNSALNGLTYTPNINYHGADVLTIATDDNGIYGANGPLTTTNTVALNVAQYNIAPQINDLGTVSANTYTQSVSASAYAQSPNPVFINNSSDFTISDTQLSLLNSGAGNYNGATLTVARSGTTSLQDVFSFGPMADVTLTGNNLYVGNSIVANITNNNGKLQISFVSTHGTIVTTALASEIIEAIQYSNNSQDPPPSVNLTYTFNDGQVAADSIVATNITVDINQTNIAPVNTVPATQIVNENTTLTFSTNNGNAISVSDIDADGGLGGIGGAETITVSVGHGILSLSGVSGLVNVIGNNTGTITATGTLSSLNAALNGLVYKPTADYYGTDNLTISTNDNGNVGSGGALTTTNSVVINVNQYNLPPAINNLGTTSVNTYIEGGAAIFVNNNANFTITDLQLNAANFGNGDYGGSTLTIARSGGANASDIFVFNTMPDVIVNPTTLTANNIIIANYTNTNGQLQINFVNTGGVPVITTLVNEIVESIMYKSSAQDLTSSIVLSYTFNDGIGMSNSAVSANIIVDVTQIDHAPINTVPTAIQTVNENTYLTFSIGNSNVISISDVDADAGTGTEVGTETVTLTVAHGILTLSGVAGLTAVSGNNTNTIVFTGTLSNLNAALNGLVYTPNVNYSGSDLLTISTDDNSNLSGGPLTTINTINLNVNQYSVAPTINNLGTTQASTYVEGGTPVYINTNTNFNVSDLQLNLLNSGVSNYNGSSLTIMRSGGANSQDVFSFGAIQGGVSVDYTDGILLVGSNIVATFTRPAGQLQLTFSSTTGVGGTIVTRTLVDNIIEAIQYTNNSQDPPSSVTLTYIFNDGLNTVNSIASSNIVVNINQIAVAPVNTVPISQSVNENANLVFSAANNNQISVSDIDADGGTGTEIGTMTVTLTVAHGILSLSETNGLTVTGNGTSNTIVATGTLTNLNSALNGLSYTPNINYHGAELLTISTDDNGNVGIGGPLTTTNTIGITVNSYNVAPSINNLGAASAANYTEGSNAVF